MSELAVVNQGGALVGARELTKEIRDKIADARDDRKRYEPTWHSNLAFAAGKFWLRWNGNTRELQFPSELVGRELYSADVITEYRTTALGELGSDDDRPQLLLRHDDQPSEDYQEQLNKAMAYGWEHEWRADEALEEVRRLALDLGTAAMRCRFDPTVGPVKAENIPHVDGKPVLDPEQARELLANGPNPDVEMKSIREGRIRWEPLSPFNLLVPPGVPNERDFPWECVVRPALLSSVKAEYGDVAADLKEDTDVGSVLGLDSKAEMSDTISLGISGGTSGRLRGHVWLYTYYERPCPDYPNGRTIVFGGGKMKPLRIEERLPYQRANGDYCSGIAYFHWWRVTGRFWSRALVESMKDVQRAINKRRTQTNEIIDRGLPAIFVESNSKAKERRGLANELIELEPHERQPVFFDGVKPGEWMFSDVEAAREDLEHATGIRGPRLGDNPVNVTTYAQLALLNENDMVKRSMIRSQHKLAIADIVESTVYDIRTYWGPQKQIALAGSDDKVDAAVFNASSMPPFFIVRIPKGSTQPRSQGAELKKIEDVWLAAVNSGAVMLNQIEWVRWYKDSLDDGQALELPDVGLSDHEDKAELENELMEQGGEPPVQYYDPIQVHVPIHRSAQIRAEEVGDIELWARIEAHVQAHILKVQETEQTMAQIAQPVAPPMEEAPADASQGPPGSQAGPPA